MEKLKQFFTNFDFEDIVAALLVATIAFGIILPFVALLVALAWKTLIRVVFG